MLAFDHPRRAARSGGAPDALRVLVRLVVAVLRRERESMERFPPGVLELAVLLLELFGPFLNSLLKKLGVLLLDLFEAFALGYVSRDGDELVGLPVGARRPFEPTVGAVLRPVTIAEMEYLTSLGRLVVNRRQRCRAVVRVHEIQQRQCRQFFG
jgi:hypothetical protein